MIQDKNGKTWSALVNEVKQIVKSNQTEDKRGYVEDMISMQILQPLNTQKHEAVGKATQEVNSNIQNIAVRAEQAFLSYSGSQED